jgi:hypothetical protein
VTVPASAGGPPPIPPPSPERTCARRCKTGGIQVKSTAQSTQHTSTERAHRPGDKRWGGGGAPAALQVRSTVFAHLSNAAPANGVAMSGHTRDKQVNRGQ